MAVCKGKQDIVEMLIGKGADLEIRDDVSCSSKHAVYLCVSVQVALQHSQILT